MFAWVSGTALGRFSLPLVKRTTAVAGTGRRSSRQDSRALAQGLELGGPGQGAAHPLQRQQPVPQGRQVHALGLDPGHHLARR